MTFWDSSALVSLLVQENETTARLDYLRTDSDLAVWWATPVECESAMQRRLREGTLRIEDTRTARARMTDLAASWHTVNPVTGIRDLAMRLLRTHPLRAADALQLAAALSIREAGITGLRFACSDQKLLHAAEAEGLTPV